MRRLALFWLTLALAGCSTPADGPDPDPEPGLDSLPPTWVDLSAGSLHTCALWRDGSPSCWGADWVDQASPPEGETFTQLSSGDFHTCGLREDSTLACWGISDGGDLDGGQVTSAPTDGGYTQIASGGWHSCAL